MYTFPCSYETLKANVVNQSIKQLNNASHIHKQTKILLNEHQHKLKNLDVDCQSIKRSIPIYICVGFYFKVIMPEKQNLLDEDLCIK
jgi:putative methionine-R-sulfoxide reductase with GAF domain